MRGECEANQWGMSQSVNMRKGPHVQRGLPRSGWGIVMLTFYRKCKSTVCIDNPSDSLTASHLPLHKGGMQSLKVLTASHLPLHKGGMQSLKVLAVSHLPLHRGGLDLGEAPLCKGGCRDSDWGIVLLSSRRIYKCKGKE